MAPKAVVRRQGRADGTGVVVGVFVLGHGQER
jgi:hypothetical protein